MTEERTTPAAPAGTGSPTPAPDVEIDLLAELEDPDDWPAPARAEVARLRRQRDEARREVEYRKAAEADAIAVGENTRRLLHEAVNERDEARAELSQVREQLDDAEAELDDWRATPPAELQSKVEAKLRAEIAEAIAAAGPRGDKPLSVIVAEIAAELSQVREDHDHLWTAWTRLASDLRQRGLPGLTDNPAEISRRVCQWVETLIQQGVDQANVIQRYSRERDEARAALAALRTEVGKIAADFDRQSTTALTAPARHIWTRAADAVRALVTDQSPAAPPSLADELAETLTLADAATATLGPEHVERRLAELTKSLPPVLAVDTEVRLADGPMVWRVQTWDVIEDESGESAIVGLRPRDQSPTSDTQTSDGGER